MKTAIGRHCNRLSGRLQAANPPIYGIRNLEIEVEFPLDPRIHQFRGLPPKPPIVGRGILLVFGNEQRELIAPYLRTVPLVFHCNMYPDELIPKRRPKSLTTARPFSN